MSGGKGGHVGSLVVRAARVFTELCPLVFLIVNLDHDPGAAGPARYGSVVAEWHVHRGGEPAGDFRGVGAGVDQSEILPG